VVDPLRVVTAEGNAYLEAWCHVAEDQRLFRLDRISSAVVLEEAVEDHGDLEPRNLADGIFQPSTDDLLVTMTLEPSARWVAEYYPVEDRVEEPGGRLTVRLRVGDPAWLTQLMLRLGASAQVTDPPDMADDVRRVAAQALQNYA
jgi:proteasome accessory factor C